MVKGKDAEVRERYVSGVKTEVLIARVRTEVADVHEQLFRSGLAVWSDGSASCRVPGADLFVIKPTGVPYDGLAPENMIVCDLDGAVLDGTPGSERAPSADTATHAYVYRSMPEVGAVVHTHSPYAVAWAARGEEIPCVTTAMADEFGGPIPLAPLVVENADDVGRAVAETLAGHRSRAVLLRSHGPYAVGATSADALRVAIATEAAARAAHFAAQLGPLVALPQEAIDHLYTSGQTRPPAPTYN